MSEPRPDTPDTGAGTPPEHGDWHEHGCPTCTTLDPLLVALNDADHIDATERDLIVRLAGGALDAARSRPATDPARLDAAALLRQFVNEGRIRHRLNPRCNELMPMDGTCTCGLREAERLARLPVADGPGPEERLREAAQAIADRSPIDTVPDALDEWCHYCNSAREAHEPTCEWAVLRAALSRPLPENREEPSR